MMKKNILMKTILPVALIATMATANLAFAGTHNKGDSGSGGNSFEIETEDPNTEYVINLTNTHTTTQVTVKGTKTWVDNDDKDGLRPDEIVVHLYADGTDTGLSYTLSEATNWEYEFTDLDSYKDGEIIEYSIKEDVPAGYTVTYEKVE